MNEQEKDEIKKRWKFFLFYGLVILVLSTIIQFELNQWLNSRAQGNPCRIDFSVEKFPMTKSTTFNLQYLLINLRDKDLLIEKTEAYCVWQTTPKNQTNQKEIIIEQPISKEILAPTELEKILALKSEIKTAINCISPDKEGTYQIKIITTTTSGTCEGNILMEVKK
jgi:hypothetical protein